MDNDLLLDMPWPADLDPATVRFKGRSETVLRRRGLYDDWSLFSELTEGEVSSWWNAGPVTIKDIRTTGNEAIRRHHDTVDLRHRIDTDLAAVALEPWAPHIWHWDPRFAMFVPKGDSTVCDMSTSGTRVRVGGGQAVTEATNPAVRSPEEQSIVGLHRGFVRIIGLHGTLVGRSTPATPPRTPPRRATLGPQHRDDRSRPRDPNRAVQAIPPTLRRLPADAAEYCLDERALLIREWRTHAPDPLG